MDIGIDKITTDQFLWCNSTGVDRDVGIDKITTDQFMLTWM